MKISVIAAVLNESPAHLQRAVDTFLGHATGDVEFILVDDHSRMPVRLENERLYVHRNSERLGVAGSRHLGAELATGEIIFITDGHCVATKGWSDGVRERLKGRPNTLLNGCCLGLDAKHEDVEKHCGLYTGARLVFHGPDANDSRKQLVFSGQWASSPDDSPISCAMGAAYGMHRSHFFSIGGLSELRSFWGSDEEALSLKTWLSGGEVRQASNVRIGHFFRGAAPYTTLAFHPVANKIRAIMSIMPEEIAMFLISKLSAQTPPLLWKEADQAVRAEERWITSYHNFYRKLFVRDVRWLCERFQLKYPE